MLFYPIKVTKGWKSDFKIRIAYFNYTTKYKDL